jgi:hypothetical protein
MVPNVLHVLLIKSTIHHTKHANTAQVAKLQLAMEYANVSMAHFGLAQAASNATILNTLISTP